MAPKKRQRTRDLSQKRPEAGLPSVHPGAVPRGSGTQRAVSPATFSQKSGLAFTGSQSQPVPSVL
jgi:hypothetical protein